MTASRGRRIGAAALMVSLVAAVSGATAADASPAPDPADVTFYGPRSCRKGHAATRCGHLGRQGDQLPANFRGRGTYIVKDMRLRVRFTWRARKGNMVMAAGTKSDPIYFKNLIYKAKLYTLTYR